MTLPPLSALAKFDDLMRCSKELTAGVAEEKFLLFLRQFEVMKMDYQRLIDEAKELQTLLENQTVATIDIERKLNYARKMLEAEKRARRATEEKKTVLENTLESLKKLLLNDNTVKDETRKHILSTWNSYTKKRKSNHQHAEENVCDEINSTGSFLSDLSLTQSGDDLLDPKPSTASNKKWKKHRPSHENTGLLNISGVKGRNSMDQRRSIRKSLLEYGSTDKIVTQTKLTIPADKRKPIHAESTIESIPQNMPTPSTSSSDENPDQFTPTNKLDFFVTPTKSSTILNAKYYTPSAPSLDDLDTINKYDQYATVIKKKPAISSRPHTFKPKTMLMNEICGFCAKRIGFVKPGLKCSGCRTNVHQDCCDKFTVSCLSQNATPSRVKSGSSMGTIGDYTPNLAPMIPALIVHCVNEIETRGLKETGLYRVPGAHLHVKALKEKFMRNNGIPNLADVDVHVLCGCVKDFLRSLSDRLIPMSLWSEFSNAVQSYPTDDDEEQVRKEVYRAVERLPQANRDTLAYLIMHLQRIAECKEVEMPLTNYAKIFGPTIVGYSCPDPDQNMLFAETQVQCSVMLALLTIPTEYWNRYIMLDQLTKAEEKREAETYGSRFYSGTPSMRVVRKERKFYNTPPYSAVNKKKK